MHTDRVSRFAPTAEVVVVSIVLLTTLLHGLSYLLSTYSASDDDLQAWSVILLYQTIIVTALIGWIAFRGYRKQLESPAHTIVGALEGCWRFLPALLVVCCIGLGFHAYSKLALIDFKNPTCVGELRHVWITTPHEQIPMFRRITSVIGHVLSGLAYAGLFFTLFRFSIGTSRLVSIAYAAAFFLVGMLYAAFIGSQNAALGLLVVAVLAIALGAVSAPSLSRGWGSRLAAVAAFTALAAMFSFSVFNNRVQCGGDKANLETFQQYETGFLDELPMKRKQALSALALFVRDTCHACNSVFIYLNHGIYNFERILAQGEARGSPLCFNFFKGVAKRLGFEFSEPPPKKRVFGLGGATLPGSAYHDFGMVGVIVAAIGHALLAILAGALLRSGSLSWEGVGLVLYVVVGFVTGLSLMFVGFNVISFPFIAISMTLVTTAVVGWTRFNGWRLGRRLFAVPAVHDWNPAAPAVRRTAVSDVLEK